MAVLISPNAKKESVRMDINGQVYDPKTKQPIQMVDPPYQPTPEEVAKLTRQEAQSQGVDLIEPVTIIDPPPRLNTLAEIKATIKKVEAHLSELQALKDKKVEEMKKELEEA